VLAAEARKAGSASEATRLNIIIIIIILPTCIYSISRSIGPTPLKCAYFRVLFLFVICVDVTYPDYIFFTSLTAAPCDIRVIRYHHFCHSQHINLSCASTAEQYN